MNEDDFQKLCANYLNLKGVLWMHVANERKTTPQAGMRLKMKGVKSGVPDILIFNPNKDFNGLAIELKIGNNKPTSNQKKWLTDLRDNGWNCFVCNDFYVFKDIVDNYFKKSQKNY